MSSSLKKPNSVGVIISTYNNPAWLEKVLWGISLQTVKNIEVIIADDGSGAPTKALIDRFTLTSGMNVKHVWQEDQGFQKSRILNKAILEASSEYLIFTDQDCIPRNDFVETHIRHSEKGYFLSGGYFKLPMSISNELDFEHVQSGVAFDLGWLRTHGLTCNFKCTKLWRSRIWSSFMNHVTPAAASWNGCNASGWKSDMLLANGFNEDIHYGGQDREFGERLWNLGLKSKQIRYSAICLHLDHERPYKNIDIVKKNKENRKAIHATKLIQTPNGIHKDFSKLPKKVFFMNTTRTWGGGEKWHLEHATSLSKSGDQVTIITRDKSELMKRSISQGLRVKAFDIGNLSFLNPWKLISFYQFLKREYPDTIIMNFSNDLKVAGPMAKISGVDRIIYRRGSAIPIRNTILNRYLYGHCVTDILANSEETKRTILQNNTHLFPVEKIKVIYNGIDTTTTFKSHTANAIPVIGNLGRLVSQKRQDLLLRIAYILKQRGVKCTFKIGGGGPLKDELEKMAIELGLTDYVEFLGPIEHPEEFHQNIDLFALTSEWEGFGYVLAEAMLAKKALIAFNISSNPELIVDGFNGKLIAFGDLERFADELQNLLENPLIRDQMGENGYKYVREHFDFEKNSLVFRSFIHWEAKKCE